MAFCSQCGRSVEPNDLYCGGCGARQPVAASKSSVADSISPRTASILCYIPMIGWIPSIVVLASDRFRGNHTVRFHAFQGLYLFVTWLIIHHVVGPMLSWSRPRIDNLMQAALIGTWIFMMIRAAQDRVYSLPIIGELAEKSASER